MGTSSPATIKTIETAAMLRAAAHPPRLRILETPRESAGRAQTVKELAAALGSPVTRLYHHVNLLAEHGLIEVAETRLVSGIVEKRYRVTAYRLSIDRALLAAGDSAADGLDVWLAVVLDEVKSEIRRAVAAGLIDLDRSAGDPFAPRKLVLGRKWFMLTPDQVAEFGRRFEEWTAAFGDGDPRDPAAAPPDAALYEMLIGFYPAVPPTRSQSARDDEADARDP